MIDPAEGLQAPFSNNGFFMNTGNRLDDFFDAYQQGVSYSSELHNVELNVRRDVSTRVTFIAGLRYINYNEKLHFFSVDDQAPNSDVGIYSVDVHNHKLGLQLGGDADFPCSSWLTVTGTATAGLFVNWVDHQTLLRNTAPDILAQGSASDTGLSGVIDVNLKATISRGAGCRLFAGYRLLLLSGMATAASQFDFAINEDPAAVLRNVDHQGSVLLHGPFAGFTREF